MAITAISVTSFTVTPTEIECGSTNEFEAKIDVTTTSDSTYGLHFDLTIYDEDHGLNPDDALIFDPAIEVDHGTNKVESLSYKLKCNDSCNVEGAQPTTGGRTNGDSGESEPNIYVYVEASSGLTAESSKMVIKCTPATDDKARRER